MKVKRQMFCTHRRNTVKMNHIFIVTICIAALNILTFAQRPDLDEHWKLYKEIFEKRYNRRIGEELNRRLIWEENVNYIESHNRLYDLGKKSFRLAINKFSDLTNKEFQEKFMGYKPKPNVNSTKIFKLTTKLESLPSEIDWREKGVVTEVKYQGECGSCWAFSATGSVEGQHALKTGKLVSLSEQNLVDCSGEQGTIGCLAGWVNDAFRYIIQNNGIDTEASYPYESHENDCRFKQENIGATIKDYVDVQKGDEDALMQAVAQVGPISVAFDATRLDFQSYSEGIFDDPECKTYIFSHAVLIVGYGTEKGGDYWLVKNSWGKDWGMDGYFKMPRNKNNQCGIASHASYPIV